MNKYTIRYHKLHDQLQYRKYRIIHNRKQYKLLFLIFNIAFVLLFSLGGSSVLDPNDGLVLSMVNCTSDVPIES